MKTISVYSPKGGVGKSTIALNLAAAAKSRGLWPVVCCLDRQGSSLLFAGGGRLPFPVLAGIPEEAPATADLVILDHMAADWDLPKPETLVMPLRPTRDNFATFADARVLADRAGKRVLPVVNDYHQNRREERFVAGELRRRGALVIPSSGAFSRAAAEYITLFDPGMDRVYNIRALRATYLKLLEMVL